VLRIVVCLLYAVSIRAKDLLCFDAAGAEMSGTMYIKPHCLCGARFESALSHLRGGVPNAYGLKLFFHKLILVKSFD
jgi:hypothetical protein